MQTGSAPRLGRWPGWLNQSLHAPHPSCQLAQDGSGPMSETAGVPSDPRWVNWQRLSISTMIEQCDSQSGITHTQFGQADGGDPDSTPQPHHKRPGQGRQSSRTLPEVPIVRQFQKFLFWICLLFTWGEAIAVSCDGSVETVPAHQNPVNTVGMATGVGKESIKSLEFNISIVLHCYCPNRPYFPCF